MRTSRRPNPGIKEHFDQPSAHVGFEDFSRMRVIQNSGRTRNDRFVPAWALDDSKIRLLIYNYACNYARQQVGKKFRPGMSLKELENLCAAARDQKIAMVKAQPGKHPTYEEHIRTSQNGIAARALRIIYKAYRERLNAKDIGEAMDMSPRSVRQMLHRLNRIAWRLFPADQQLPRHWSTKGLTPRRTPWNIVRPMNESELTPQIRSIAERYNSGVSAPKIAKQEGMAYSALWYRLRRSGLINRVCKHDPEPKSRRKHRSPLSEELIRRWTSGERTPVLAAEIGMPYSTLKAKLRRLGIARSVPRGKRKPGFSEAQVQELARRWRAGETANQLAAECGIPPNTFMARLRKFGIRRGPVNGKHR